MATRYFVNGGVDDNWGTTGNWSLTDGGAGGQAVPTASDDVFFTANSPVCDVDASARVALSLNFTGYTNTITFNQTLTVSGSITLAAGATFAGNSALIMGATGTFTSNGKTYNQTLKFQGTSTITMADNLTVSGTLQLGNTTQTTTINGNTINISGNLDATGTTGICLGTTNFVMNGTGAWSNSGGSTYQIRNNLTFNTAGTITVSGSVYYNTGTLTYTAGTITTTGSTLLSSVATTFATNGMTWNNVTLSGAITFTLSNDMAASGLVTLGTTTNATVLNGSNFNISGSLRDNTTTGTISGTTVFVLNGTGTWDAPAHTTGRIGNSITINTAGTITISGTVATGGGTFTHTAGTVVTTSSTVEIRATGTTLNVSGITFNNFTITGAAITITLTSDLNISGTLNAGNTSNVITINGAFNVNVASFVLGSGATTGTVTGTATLIFNGTGSWTSGSTVTNGALSMNTTINTSGTLTLGSIIHYRAGTLTFTSGTVTAPSGSIIICTTTAPTISNAIAGLSLGTIQTEVNITFAGTEGITLEGLTSRLNSFTCQFVSGETYTITKALVIINGPGNASLLRSTTASSDAFLNVSSGALVTLIYVGLTDINASGGTQLTSTRGTLTRTTNVVNSDLLALPTGGGLLTHPGMAGGMRG